MEKWSYPQCLKAREALYILFVKLTPMALKIGRHDLTNRVKSGQEPLNVQIRGHDSRIYHIL
jgi:hypothetical protein